MGSRPTRPVPDLSGSTLAHHSGELYVDTVTGLVLTRVGYASVQGYERVHLDHKETHAHRIVWEAVHGPIPDGLTINHIDGDKLNNRIENLELATMSDQIRHAYATGLRVGNGNLGRKRGSRLTSEQIAELDAATYGTIGALAHAMGISRSYAYQVRRRRRLALHAG